MRAVVVRRPGGKISAVEVAKPWPGPGEVSIDVA